MATAYTLNQAPDADAHIVEQFTTSTRPDGSTYVTCPDDSDAHQLVRHVHFNVFDGMLPNDWVYAKTREILELLAESDDDDTDVYELADVYSADKYAWLASNLVFAGFVNASMADYHYDSIDAAINGGQCSALSEMEWCIRDWMAGYADTRS